MQITQSDIFNIKSKKVLEGILELNETDI
jgi:hypothetical protein